MRTNDSNLKKNSSQYTLYTTYVSSFHLAASILFQTESIIVIGRFLEVEVG